MSSVILVMGKKPLGPVVLAQLDESIRQDGHVTRHGAAPASIEGALVAGISLEER